MRIAITGGIASGKSTVINQIKEFGLEATSADALVKDIFWEPEIQAQLAQILGVEGEVSPKQLRIALEADDELRRDVNALFHPRVQELLEADDAPFHEIPLLYEACMQAGYSAVWVVSCPLEVQLARLAQRYGDAQASSMVRTQVDDVVRRVMADTIIDSSVPEAAMRDQVFQELLRYELIGNETRG